MSKITFFGLGSMGMPMAKNILAAGHTVFGFDLSEGVVDNFISIGGKHCCTPAEAIKQSDIVITMLPNGAVVRSVLLGTGISRNALMKRKPIVIDMSSSSPTETQSLAKDLNNIGITLIDAPVSGGVNRAESGTLAIMMGGTDQSIGRVRNVLSAMSKQQFHTGPVGSGHATKAINNFVSAAGLIASCEAIQLGEQFGITPNTLLDVLNSSSGKNNATENKVAQFILNERFNSGFSMPLMNKDLSIATSLSDDLSLTSPLLSYVNKLWGKATSQLPSTADHTEIIKYISALSE